MEGLKDQTVEEGDSVTIVCMVSHSSSTVTWQKDGHPLECSEGIIAAKEGLYNLWA